jgi:hypothetical protein
MEQIAFKIAAFSIILNLAIGLFTFMGNGGNFPSATSSQWGTNHMIYSSSFTTADENSITNNLTGSPVSSQTTWSDRVLDFFTLGLYTKGKALIYNTMFGLVNFLVDIEIINDTLAVMLRIFLGIVYTAGVYELFTGRSILGG